MLEVSIQAAHVDREDGWWQGKVKWVVEQNIERIEVFEKKVLIHEDIEKL